MTEIPEHLLKRSRERRQAMGLPSEAGEAPAESAPASAEAPASPATATPAKAAAAQPPAPPSPPAAAAPPPPPPPYIQAAQRRRRIPIWAMPVLALLPLWLWLYMQAMQPPEEELVGPLAAGEAVYGTCASCHGANGEGGVGYQLNNGEVLKTFPEIEAQLGYIYTGNAPYIGQPYGDPDREGGQRIGGALGGSGAMPAWGETAGGELSDLEILEVVCHERFTLAGGDEASEEFASWCSADGEKFLEVEEGGFEMAGVPTSPEG